MPTVPTYQRQTQTEAAAPQVANIQYSPDNFGAGLAQVADNATNLFAQEQRKANLAFSQDALLQFNQHADDLMNNPENGLITKQGKNALGQSDGAIKNLDELMGGLAGSLPDGEARQNFMLQAQQSRQQFMNQSRQYEVGQFKQYEASQFKGLKDNTVTQAKGLYGDSGAFNKLVGNQGFVAIDQYADTHGWSDEQRIAAKVELKEQAGAAAVLQQMSTNVQSLVNDVGEPSDIGGVSRLSAHGNSSAARGVRNNNPGNIEATEKNPWEGQTGNDGRFATFATPEHGIRALSKNLISYNNQGYNTISEVVNRWAPASDNNNTDAYIKALCGALGVGADDQLDITNPRTLAALCAGIVKHENGNQPYSDEQINTGVSAALGLTALDSPKRYTGNAAFDASNPQMQMQFMSQAQTLQKEQRTQLSQQLDLQVKDVYAATDEGLQPSYIPSQQSLVSAKGPIAGAQQWQDMQEQLRYGGIVGAAKNLTPSSRQELLETMRPSDPNMAGFAKAQQRWEKMEAKFTVLDKEWEANQATQRVASSLEKNFPLDPTDKNNQLAADNYFNSQVAPNFNINNSETLGQLATLTTRTGIIPTQIKSMMNAASTSRDPALVVPMAKLYGQIFDNNPAAATGVDSGTMAFFTKVYSFDRAGVPADKAVDMAYNLVYQQDERTKQMVNTQLRDKDFIVARDKAAQSNINNISPGWFSGPDAQKPGTSNQLYMRDYQTIYDANFAQTGGDAQQAEAMTNAQIKSVWGISSVNGSKEVMKYAPEAVYGINNGSGNWIPEQWEQEKGHLKAVIFGGSRDDTDLIIVADALTPRDNSYSVMVKQRNAEGFDDVSSYHGASGLPVRFKPDQKTSPMYQRVMLLQQQGINEARAKRIGAPINEADNYLNSGQLHKAAQNNAPITNTPSNMIAGGK
ncbi:MULTISPECIES: hypothetical protein [Yersinia]|uniref:Bacteriophage protein n=1 Tax=Yersinia frederiksenii TaxID=29484 RepID=A0AAI8ZNC9_YERFR|nr:MULTISPECIES: hypothetical protein [Yersinia]MDN0126859.1 hypothetical protein [Yersinia massiliensis]CFQ88045.1 Uncharacterised protein [Yersinia frederiksenii]